MIPVIPKTHKKLPYPYVRRPTVWDTRRVMRSVPLPGSLPTGPKKLIFSRSDPAGARLDLGRTRRERVNPIFWYLETACYKNSKSTPKTATKTIQNRSQNGTQINKNFNFNSDFSL